MFSLLLAVCLGLPAAPNTGTATVPFTTQPFQDSHARRGSCGAGNARRNTASTPIMGGPGAYQHVPVIPDGGRNGAFYVAYSAKSSKGNGPCATRTNNSVISVFKLSSSDRSGSQVLIYGTGYGGRFLNGSPCNGAQYQGQGAAIDAKNVSDIVRKCMELGGTIKVDVVVPHSHADHINPEFLHELEALDFKVQAIMTHADDLGATRGVDKAITTHNTGTGRWGSLISLIQPFGKKAIVPCLQTVCTSRLEDAPLSYQTVAGPVWFRERGGHTAGATDLILDAGGKTNRRFVVYGSSPPGTPASVGPNCMAPACGLTLPGVIARFSAHGNLRYK